MLLQNPRCYLKLFFFSVTLARKACSFQKCGEAWNFCCNYADYCSSPVIKHKTSSLDTVKNKKSSADQKQRTIIKRSSTDYQLCKLKGLQKSNLFQVSGYWHDHQNSAHCQESNNGGTNFHTWSVIPLRSGELCIICLLLAELDSWHPECLEMNLHSFLFLTSQYYCHNETCNISAHRGLISFCNCRMRQ